MKLPTLSLLLATFSFLAGPSIAGTCDADSVELRGSWGQARFTVEVADEDAERNKGLMFRTELAAAQGMLFVYSQPRSPSFWMKNTLIPLDMLFITPEGIVKHIHPMAKPQDLSLITGGDGVLMVLEIRGGMAKIMGISEGSEIRYPALNQSLASWPCESTD